MNAKKLFIKELSFLKEEYDFDFVDESSSIQEKYIYKKDSLEIVYLFKTLQFEYVSEFYYSYNGWKTKLDVDYEYKKLFNKSSLRNYFCQLARILRFQLKENKIFGYIVY